MSTPATTRVFGVRLGIDPKILVGVLVVFAGLLFWYNSRSDDVPTAPVRPSATRANVPAAVSAPLAAAPRAKSGTRRTTSQTTNDRGFLRLRPVDATRGDIDPTLHLELLSRLQAVKSLPSTRSLFEIGAAPVAMGTAAPLKGPKIVPKPLPLAPPAATVATTPTPPPINIPLRYYGFVRPAEIGKTNSGLFLDGENVLVVSEGQVVKQRYLIVELTPTSARIEDTQMRGGQTIPVIPVANP